MRGTEGLHPDRAALRLVSNRERGEKTERESRENVAPSTMSAHLSQAPKSIHAPSSSVLMSNSESSLEF